MEKIYRIEYADAHYSYEPDLYTKGYYIDGKDLRVESTSVHFFSAHGYLETHDGNIVIAFIKKRGVLLKDTIEKGENIVKGLVLPDTALLSNVRTSSRNVLKEVKIGLRVAVTWRDVVYVANQPRYDCSIMYTEGVLHKIENDHIVLRDTETIRVHPMPAVNHPAGRPMWYSIPISFIKDIEIIP